jgi:DNA-binding winged helix-turn-helix (wHTH) protein
MIYSFGLFELDEQTRELRRNGQPVKVQPLVFDLLTLLLRNRERVVDKEEIQQALWPAGFASEGSLQRAVSMARSAVGDDSHTLIRTFTGRGYRFDGDVSEERPLRAVIQTLEPEGRKRAEVSIRYAKSSDGVNIAYSTIGDGPHLVWAAQAAIGFSDEWIEPQVERFSQSFTVVRYFGRGTGLSDRDVDDVGLDARVADLAAVADHLGSRKHALWAPSVAAPTAIAYAARYPERVTHLILWAAVAQPRDMFKAGESRGLSALAAQDWDLFVKTFAHVVYAWSEAAAKQYAEALRKNITPETWRQYARADAEIDVSDLLDDISAPTLVLVPRGAKPLESVARRLASSIPTAHLQFVGQAPSGLAEDPAPIVEEFAGVRRRTEPRLASRG